MKEREASFFEHAIPLLGSESTVTVGDGMQMATIIDGEAITEHEVHWPFNVAILKVVSAHVIV